MLPSPTNQLWQLHSVLHPNFLNYTWCKSRAIFNSSWVNTGSTSQRTYYKEHNVELLRLPNCCMWQSTYLPFPYTAACIPFILQSKLWIHMASTNSLLVPWNNICSLIAGTPLFFFSWAFFLQRTHNTALQTIKLSYYSENTAEGTDLKHSIHSSCLNV